MKIEEIKTDKLLLKKFIPETYRLLYENYSDNELMKILLLNSIEELNKEKEKYKQGLSTYNISFVYFKLFDIHSGKHIGNCGFHKWYFEHSRAEIGYDILDNSLKRKGLMTEAMELILKYGFNKMNLNRIEAYISRNNIPSLNLVKKLGFRKEGILREHYYKSGKIEDSIVFSLLKKDHTL